MANEREQRRQRQIKARAYRQDMAFFKRHGRFYRVRKALAGEFSADETHALVYIKEDESGSGTMLRWPFKCDAEVPDDEATAEYLATLIEGAATLDRAEPLEIKVDLGLPEPAKVVFTFPGREED